MKPMYQTIAPGAMQDYTQAMREQQMAQALMKHQAPVNNPLDIFANALRTWKANKMSQQADESIADVLERSMKYQHEQEQAELSRKAAEQQAAIQNLVDTNLTEQQARAVVSGHAKIGDFNKPQKDDTPASIKTFHAVQNMPPEQREAYMEYVKSTKGGLTVDMAGETYTPMQEEMSKINAKDFSKWREDANQGQLQLDNIQFLEGLSELQNTGKVEDLMAGVTQFFGSDAGANMQAYNAAAAEFVTQAAESMKGALSDNDIKFLKAIAPQFSNDPRANQTILNKLRLGAQRKIERFKLANDYYGKHNKLDGFTPTYSNMSVDISHMPNTKKSADDLVNFYSGGQ